MKIDYSFTNISHSLQTALNLLNIGRKHITNWDKHVYGRLISKIQNSYILIFTDGGKLNNQHKVFRKNSKINLAIQDEDEIYLDPYSWDQNLISIIMNPQPDEESLYLLNKYTTVIGGKVLSCENFEDYMNKIEKLAFSDFLLNRVNMFLEINNNVINIIQQNEIKSREKEIFEQFGQLGIGNMTNNMNLPNFALTQNFPKIKFKNKNTFNKGLVPLTFDLKQFKQISLNIAGNDLIFDRNENISFKEKWPLPDDFLMNKTIKTLQKKKSHPSYVIANEPQYDFEIKRMDYDEYEIEDKEFIIRFLENYPDLTVKVFKELVKNNNKIIWDVFSFMSMAENILKKPFAVVKLNLSNKVATLFNSKNLMHDELPIFEYIKQSDYDSHIQLKLCVLPYNYREYFQIIQNFQSNSINKTEFIIQMEKYMMRIPFYYKPYVVANLEKKNLWKGEENFGKNLDEENLNENVLACIKNVVIRENEKMIEMNKIYIKNKQLHINNSSNCCGINIFKLNKKEEDAAKNYSSSNKVLSTSFNDKSYVDFLNDCSDFQSFINVKKLENTHISTKKDSTMKINKKALKDDLEISKMGDFYENVIKMTPLRNPYLFDFEIKEFRGDYFGNPFRKLRVDTELYGNLNLENPNINIKDGEVLLINCDNEGDAKQSTKCYSQSLSKQEILDEELSIRPGQILPCDKNRIKTSLSPLTTVNQIVDAENKMHNKKRKRNIPSDDSDNVSDQEILSKSTKSARSDTSLPNKLQMQLIDDDLTGEFKQLFARNISDKNDRNDIIVNNSFNIDMNVIYDWKLKEKLKECKIYIKNLDSKAILENAKSSNKNIVKILDDILSKPFLFYTDRQKISFISKVKNICEAFGSSKLIIQQINEMLNNI